MTYNEIKSKIDDCRKRIFDTKKLLRSNEEEHTQLKQSMQDVETNYQLNLRNEKDKALSDYLDKAVFSVNDDIAAVDIQLNDTNERYTKEIEKLENSDISNLYSDEQAMTAEVRASLAVLQENMSKSVSNRFQVELENQLDTQQINIEPDDVDGIVRFFNKQSRNISKLSKGSTLDNFMEKVLNAFHITLPDKAETNKDKVTYGVLSIVIIVLFVLAAKYVFPFYVLFLFLLMIYNIAKHYKIFTALIAQKVVKDNLSVIEDSLKESAIKQRDMKIANLRKEFDDKMLSLQQTKDSLLATKNSTLEQARSSFKFDDSSTQDRYQNAVKINNSRLLNLEKNNTQLTEHLSKLQQELETYEKELTQIAGDAQSSYLNYDKIGDAIEFNPKFIIDVKNKKPVFFTHPKDSVLFIYDRIEDVNDFIRLIVLQLRIRMNPSNLLCTLIDVDGLGVSCLPFNTVAEDDEAISSLFKILTDRSEIKTALSEYNDIVAKRIMSIRKSYANIEEYNRDMQSSDSLTETFDFIFFINPSTQQVNEEDFRKVFSNGGSLGVYMNIFIKKDEFYNMGEPAKQLIDNCGGIFVIQDGNIQKRAKEFALEKLIKSEN